MALFKRKDKDTKKGGETTIGKIIYGFLLFMPLLSIGARCLYVIFNKNAYQSYSDYEIQDTITVTTSNNLLIENRDYVWTYTQAFGDNATDFVYFNSISENILALEPNYTIVAFRLTGNANLMLRDSNNQDHTRFNYFTNDNAIKTFNFNYKSTTLPAKLINSGKLLLINYKKGTMDNVFEYSINQTQESNIYNWAKQTGTYTVLNNTTTGLGITNEFIPMLMAYWLIVSVIYFLFDIALILIWAVHKKIHELSEAI